MALSKLNVILIKCIFDIWLQNQKNLTPAKLTQLVRLRDVSELKVLLKIRCFYEIFMVCTYVRNINGLLKFLRQNGL